MADKYINYAALKAAETIGVDYRIQAAVQSDNFIIVAPHAGGIEVGTTELTLATAGNDTSYYLFEGLKSSGNGDLHITSTHFDEPIALHMMQNHEFGLSYHGYADSENEMTIIGGLSDTLKEAVYKSLSSYGFNVAYATDRFTATDPNNIVNRAIRRGVQLELSTAQRKAFFEGGDWSKDNRMNRTDAFYNYVTAVRYALT